MTVVYAGFLLLLLIPSSLSLARSLFVRALLIWPKKTAGFSSIYRKVRRNKNEIELIEHISYMWLDAHIFVIWFLFCLLAGGRGRRAHWPVAMCAQGRNITWYVLNLIQCVLDRFDVIWKGSVNWCRRFESSKSPSTDNASPKSNRINEWMIIQIVVSRSNRR